MEWGPCAPYLGDYPTLNFMILYLYLSISKQKMWNMSDSCSYIRNWYPYLKDPNCVFSIYPLMRLIHWTTFGWLGDALLKDLLIFNGKYRTPWLTQTFDWLCYSAKWDFIKSKLWHHTGDWGSSEMFKTYRVSQHHLASQVTSAEDQSIQSIKENWALISF